MVQKWLVHYGNSRQLAVPGGKRSPWHIEQFKTEEEAMKRAAELKAANLVVRVKPFNAAA